MTVKMNTHRRCTCFLPSTGVLRRAPTRSNPTVCSLTSRRLTQNTATPATSHSSTAATAALDKESSENRYVDLRTLKTIPWEEAHLASDCASGSAFGPFDHSCDDAFHSIPQELLFSHETIPLSQSQKDVIRALLSRRSVIFHSTSGDPVTGITADLALRAKLWNQTVLYCASSTRAAEAMHAALSVQVAGIAPDGIILDTGDANSRPSSEHLRNVAALPHTSSSSIASQTETNNINVKQSSSTDPAGSEPEDANARKSVDVQVPSVIITVPHILLRNLICAEENSWMKFVDVAILDNLLADSNSDWEELLLSMPSRVIVCLIAKDLSVGAREQILLWFETVHNNVIPIVPPGAASVLDRVERCVELPVLRAFVYNAARHSAPVQVSLRLLLDAAQKEPTDSSVWSKSNYLDSLLKGVTILEAMKPEDLLFRNAHEAEFADFVSILLHEFVRTSKAARSKFRKRPGSKKTRTASSISAARKRRSTFFADSLMFPAIVLVQGRLEVVSVANALISACDDGCVILWDEGSREHLHDILHLFVDKHSDALSDEDRSLLSMLSKGIGVVHNDSLPGVRLLTEELFRDGFIPVLFVDTHLGPVELSALPTAKSVIVESSAFGEIDDGRKGLVKGSTAASLAGRIGKDDVGNLIVMWYDDAIDDTDAVTEMATSLLMPDITERSRVRRHGRVLNFHSINMLPGEGQFLKKLLGPHRFHRSRDVLWSSYAGLLRSLQKFGLDGYKSVIEYTLDSYQGWLVGATLRATREKMDLEQKAIEDRLSSVNWAEVALHDRRVAKHQESVRIMKAMQSHRSSVLGERVIHILRKFTPGTIIGIRASENSGELDETQQISATSDQKPLPSESSTPYPEDGAVTRDSNMKALSIVNSGIESNFAGNVPAVFVSLLERSKRKSWVCPLEASYVVISIMMDGVWTMVPSQDVLCEPDPEAPKVSDVDLLEIPHLATFDLDPVLGWAKCKPVTQSETLALARVSDDLISVMASNADNMLKPVRLPEFEKQKHRLQSSLRLLQTSPWFGKEEELQEIRQLRRRAAKLSDDSSSFKDAETQLEQELNQAQERRKSIQSARLAVLEDCNAIRIHSADEMEMTPIGSLSSILPGAYPLFSAACLLLVDGVKNLNPMELAAFVAMVTCADTSSVRYSGGSDDDMSSISVRPGVGPNESRLVSNGDREVDDLVGVLPSEVLNVADEILRALHMLQHRHTVSKGLTESKNGTSAVNVATIAPAKLGLRCARPAFCFARGDEWSNVVSVRGIEPRDTVLELRKITQVLSIIASGGSIGEFSSTIQKTAQRAMNFMQRWPVRDVCDTELLIGQGVVNKEWQVQSYDRWWKASRDQIQEFVRQKSDDILSKIETVEAEVIE